jgi:hypothetical protein
MFPPHTPQPMLDVIGIPLLNAPELAFDWGWRTIIRLTGAVSANWWISAMKEAAERLNAALIVAGSVRKAGSEIWITINLVDSAGGCYLWSGTIDRTLEGIFAVQEEVARTVAEQLKRELVGGVPEVSGARWKIWRPTICICEVLSP